MNMRELRWRYMRVTDLAGKPYSELRRWIEDLVKALFPDNGIEYFADPGHLDRKTEAPPELTPKEGKPEWVSSVICAVFHGANEGRHIDVSLRLRDGTVKQVTWAKSFGPADECWAIARVISEALELIFHYQEQPEIVDMYRLLPREHQWLSAVKIPGGVTVERDESSVSLRLAGNVLLAQRKFGGRTDIRKMMMDAYQQDWLTLFQAHQVSVRVKVKELTTDTVEVASASTAQLEQAGPV